MKGRKYVKLDVAYVRHPKTRRLIGLLGRGAEMIPIRLWCHCGEHHFDTGTLAGYSGQEIESIVEWWGKAGECVIALLKVGFLKQLGEGFEIHDWLDHSGHLKFLSDRGKANADKRWRPPPEDDAGSNAGSIPDSNASISFSLQNEEKKEIENIVCRFQKPTIEEIAEYCREKGYNVDPARFFAYYEANGWKIGKAPMKRWRAAVAYWHANNRENTNGGTNGRGGGVGPARLGVTETAREQQAERDAQQKTFLDSLPDSPT